VDEVDEVVADRLVRSDELERWSRHRDALPDVAKGQQGRRPLHQVAERREGRAQAVAQVNRPREHRRADRQRTVERRERTRQLARGGPQAPGQVGEVGQERPGHAERLDRGGERRRRLLDRVLERGGVLGERGEGVGHLREQARLHLGDRRNLGGRLAQLDEEAVETGVRIGQVAHDRHEIAEEGVKRLDRRVQ
jgi:hypothetical protein